MKAMLNDTQFYEIRLRDPLPDQAALFGVLIRVHDLGLVLPGL